MTLLQSDDFPGEIVEAAKTHIQPHLVPIYDSKPDQVGTGFLIKWQNRPLLVTAKHVLYGHSFNENPAEKSVFVGGQLTQIGGLKSHALASDEPNDLAVMFIDEYPLERCLPYTALTFGSTPPKLIGIYGYLARDFHRSALAGKLEPQPFFHNDIRVDQKAGSVCVRYTNRARTAETQKVEMTPIPQGISGGPMVKSESLLLNEVKIVGVFTDQRLQQGYVFGTPIQLLQPLLQKIAQSAPIYSGDE